MAPVTRDGVEYEFDIVGDLDLTHTMVFSKTRCSALTGKAFRMPGENVTSIIRAWLNDESANGGSARSAADHKQVAHAPSGDDEQPATPAPAHQRGTSNVPAAAAATPTEPAHAPLAKEELNRILVDVMATTTVETLDRVKERDIDRVRASPKEMVEIWKKTIQDQRKSLTAAPDPTVTVNNAA